MKKSTGRKCICCSHEKAKEINTLVNDGVSFRAISRRLIGNDSMRESVRRHVENCLKFEIAALIKQKKIENAIDHYREIGEQLEFAKELRIAARQYLSDPETGALTLIPRAKEVVVIYEDYDDRTREGQPKKKRDNLDNLLEKLESVRQFQLELLKLDFERISENFHDETHEEFIGEINELLNKYKSDYVAALKTEIKHVDIRSFALDSIRTTDTVLDKIFKLEGLYQKDRENDDATAKLKALIEKRARDKGVEYGNELRNFLENYADDVLPDIKMKLASDLVN